MCDLKCKDKKTHVFFYLSVYLSIYLYRLIYTYIYIYIYIRICYKKYAMKAMNPFVVINAGENRKYVHDVHHVV